MHPSKRTKCDHVMLMSNEIRVESYLVEHPGGLIFLVEVDGISWQCLFQYMDRVPVISGHPISINH